MEPEDKNERSIKRLQRLLDKFADIEDLASIFRDLNAIRSRGGVAHLSNSDSDTAFAAFDIDPESPCEAFEKVVKDVGDATVKIGKLLPSTDPAKKIQANKNTYQPENTPTVSSLKR